MSYILDALKRAESDRGLGGVPGLHAQTLAVDPATRPVPRSWLTAGLLAAALLGAALVWVIWRLQSSGGAVAPVQQSAAKSVAAPAAEHPPASLVLNAPTAQPIRPPTPIGAPAHNTASADTTNARRQPREARVAGSTPGSSSAPAMTASQDGPQKRAPPVTSSTATPKGPEVIDGLSAQAQATLPKLQVSGGTYSENAAYRMVIINGQVLKEGQTAAPDTRLERINPRSVVVDFRGTRYSLPY
jgi:general secretion pathway protein B